MSSSARDAFAQRRPFPFDQFQVDAMDALDEGDSVLVVAPTGSGKTVVGEYAIELALHQGTRAFYTTPLKALSNQKFHDLIDTYGADKVGLLTGDNVINGDAPVVVMTTEVLRNMIYARSPALDTLRYVILDEVHYLQNAYRGPVWEEVIIHTPPEVTLVSLSATVSNAEELATWIKTVRGTTVPILEEKRPVELEQHYMVATRKSSRPIMLPTFTRAGRPNPKAAEYDAPANKPWQRKPERGQSFPPDRFDVVELLRAESMLPAIYFIFSRNGCNDAVKQCVNANVRLTTDDEVMRIRMIAEAAVETLSDNDLDVLGYPEWVHALESGVAAHHAGMVTPFKEAVEACFTEALVKVVFATETLALGINMPARTVVIEKLTKFTGERHEQLTPGEYTQLTGRAGRRGIDDVGHAVVLWNRFITFDQVAGLASTRTYTLTSSFHPTYNMAANLIRRYQPAEARHLLNLSFAQYRTDADVVRIESQLENVTEAIANARRRLECERGDVVEWQTKHTRSGGAEDSADRIMKAVANLKVGDVIDDPGTRVFQQLLVITTSQRRGHELRLGVLTPEGRRFNLTSRDFTISPHRLRHIELPKPYNPSNKEFVKRAAASLSAEAPSEPNDEPGVGGCPDLSQHLKAMEDVARLTHEHDRLETRVKARSESLARQFDRVLGVLQDLEYVDGWSLTDAGEALARTYHESDLLVVESVRRGIFDGLDPASLAAVTSALTFESRGPATNTTPKFPTPEVQQRVEELSNTWMQLATVEQQLALTVTRAPDGGFAMFAHAWTSGQELASVLIDETLSGGDFVRNVKQLVDLLLQVSNIAEDPHTVSAARSAADSLNRDVVAAASSPGVR